MLAIYLTGSNFCAGVMMVDVLLVQCGNNWAVRDW